MKWWCFNREQLDAALEDWERARIAEMPAFAPAARLDCATVREFLTSDQARAHKLRGDHEQP